MLILVTWPRGYNGVLCAIVCTWLSVCVRSPYLWVETEGFGRFPDAQQIKYDLLHGKVQSLLNRGQINWCYKILEVWGNKLYVTYRTFLLQYVFIPRHRKLTKKDVRKRPCMDIISLIIPYVLFTINYIYAFLWSGFIRATRESAATLTLAFDQFLQICRGKNFLVIAERSTE